MIYAEKPDLPIPAWARDFHGEAVVVTYMECAAHANAIEAWARADERRKALEEAAQSFEKFFAQTDTLDVGYVCGAIRALINKE